MRITNIGFPPHWHCTRVQLRYTFWDYIQIQSTRMRRADHIVAYKPVTAGHRSHSPVSSFPEGSQLGSKTGGLTRRELVHAAIIDVTHIVPDRVREFGAAAVGSLLWAAEDRIGLGRGIF